MRQTAARNIALGLLALGGLTHYAWQWVAPDWAADVWQIGQSALVLCLLALVAGLVRDAWVTASAALIGAWQLMAGACSALWLWRPWDVAAGAEQCSAAVGLPLGLFGLWLLAMLAIGAGSRQRTSTDRSSARGTT